MSAENLDDSAQPLIEHLTELRQRLIYAAGAFIVAMVFCYMFWKPAFFFLTEPVCAALASRGQDCALSLIKMQEGFFTAINISFLGGFALAFDAQRPLACRLRHLDHAVGHRLARQR